MAAALLAWPGRCRAAQGEALDFAVLPLFSGRTLLRHFEGLRAFLQERLNRPAYLVTAPDFRAFTRAVQNQAYPFVLTAPHLARLAEVDAGYRALAAGEPGIAGVFLVDRASEVDSLADLRGRSLATPDSLAVVTMLGNETLTAAGLTPGRDIVLNPQPSHNAAALTVLRGENAAALVWDLTLSTMEHDLRDRLKVIARTSVVPAGLVFLTRGDMPASQSDAIRDALFRFKDVPAGQEFLTRTGFKGVVPIEPGQLAYLDRYLAPARRLLAAR